MTKLRRLCYCCCRNNNELKFNTGMEATESPSESIAENDDDTDDGGSTVREITDAEKKLLVEASTKECDGSNVHFWRVYNDFSNVCSMFAGLQVAYIALGGEHILVLTIDFKVFVQGSNSHGQLGQGDTEERTGLCLVTQLNGKEVKQIACGARHNAVVCTDGTLYCWGDSRQGQCGVGAKGIFTIPTKINFPRSRKISHKDSPSFSINIKQVSCGELFTVAIDSRGAAWTWGSGLGLGHGDKCDECILPTLVRGLRHRKIINVVCGSFHCIVITLSDVDGSVDLPSPDYNVADIFSNYTAAAEDSSRLANRSSTVPFLQSTFYSSHGEEQTEETESVLVRSHSETDILQESNVSSQGVPAELETSTSAIELRKSMDLKLENKMEEQTKVRERNMTLNLASHSMDDCEASLIGASKNPVNASQYYSALEVFGESTLTLTSRDVYATDSVTTTPITEIISNDRLTEFGSNDPINEISALTIIDDDEISIQSSNTSLVDGSFNDGKTKEKMGDATFLETISIKTIDSDCSAASASVEASNENLIKQKDDDNESDILFDGKTSLFDEHKANYHGYNVIERTSTFEQFKAKKSMYRLASQDSSEGALSLSSSMKTEVWSWGKNSYGQLGTGSYQDCAEPTLVEKLKSKGILRLAAGSYHSLAISVHGQVYSWGDNTFGQLAHSRSNIDSPKKIKSIDGVRVWDISAGRTFSLMLGDRDKSMTDVLFCGVMESMKDIQSETLSDPVINIPPEKRKVSSWRLSRRSKRYFNESSSLVDIQIRKVIHMEKELVRSVVANDYSFLCVTNGLEDGIRMVEPIYKFARSERLFHHQLSAIQKNVIEPFLKTESWQNITKMVGGIALVQLVDSFVDLLNGISTELAHLTDVIRFTLPDKELFSCLFSDSFRAVYERYSKCYSDALAVGLFQTCNKYASHIISKLRNLMNELEKHWSLSPVSFETLLKAPLMRAHVYCDIAKRVTLQKKDKAEIDHLKEVITRWLKFTDKNTQRLISAGVTYKYWNECHQKLTDALKDPQRRVLKSSKSDPLSLHRASRLSSHSYILCNDVFVHVQFNRNFQVFPLVTLWADSVPDSETTQNAIKITSPEDSFVLAAGTSDGKVAWLRQLNQAIASCLNACSHHSLDIDAVNSSSGLLKAAVAREARYTYVDHPQFKSGTYKGMWFDGLPHGRGKMTWDDGVYYEGEFVSGTFQGHGEMYWPANSTCTYDKKYDGEWAEGKMNGHGNMSYGQGDEYVGQFKNGYRHGYGTLKSSPKKLTLDTIYIGDWENDMKSGYGVLDYIVRGEKYMGMWSNDQRNGSGVVVTVDGVYYEGNFFQNRLAGRGILLNEDETCYEGEFTADMLLSGKGVLTLPNGDFIDGTFYGKWGDNIKVNGIFSKFTNPVKNDDMGSSHLNFVGATDFTIEPDLKWKSLFEECLAVFGCENTTDFDSHTAWKNVNQAVLKASGSVGTARHPSTSMFSKKTLFKEEMALANNLKGLQDYLAMAFCTKGHPLNTLVESLVEVYRATYVGVGAHRRLLPHAVAEAKSYVKRLFNVLRVLFPDLHDEDFVMLSNETYDGTIDHTINSMSLLHPLILPQLYPPLFTLYALQTEKTDATYTEKLYYLNKRSDMALMSFLGIKNTFWLSPDTAITSTAEDEDAPKAYSAAIENLGQISTTYSPMCKIEVIRRTFAKIHEEIEEYHKGVRQILAMDDLFPLFQYIVIRARVPHLGSEIKFIEDLVDASVLVGEAGHMVTTLSACYFQIQQERDRD